MYLILCNIAYNAFLFAKMSKCQIITFQCDISPKNGTFLRGPQNTGILIWDTPIPNLGFFSFPLCVTGVFCVL